VILGKIGVNILITMRVTLIFYTLGYLEKKGVFLGYFNTFLAIIWKGKALCGV
jgi:uncharacterized membrane protein (DUF441 family)